MTHPVVRGCRCLRKRRGQTRSRTVPPARALHSRTHSFQHAKPKFTPLFRCASHTRKPTRPTIATVIHFLVARRHHDLRRPANKPRRNHRGGPPRSEGATSLCGLPASAPSATCAAPPIMSTPVNCEKRRRTMKAGLLPLLRARRTCNSSMVLGCRPNIACARRGE